jgi:glucose-1-phosphate adenylyltransferase
MKKPIDPREINHINRDTLALVMAGGRGSRLKQLTSRRAKPAVHFGGKYRIVDFTLSNCINSGICRIGVLTQYKSHSLIHHLQAGWGFLRGRFGEFMELLPADQNPGNDLWYRGTADAVYQNLDFIRVHRPKHVLVLAGDHVYKQDYSHMLAQHVQTGAKATVACVEAPIEDARHYGVLETDENLIVNNFREKPRDPAPMVGNPNAVLASMGIYIFDADFLIEELQRDAQRSSSTHDFGSDVIPSVIEGGEVYAYRFSDYRNPEQPGFWRDVGTLDAYWKANMELLDVVPEFNLYDERWPIWTHQEQVPPAKFVFNNDSVRGAAVDSLVSEGCIVSGSKVERSVLFVSARVDECSHVQESLLLPSARIGKDCRITRAIIDAGCRVPDGMVIGEDVEEDQRYFEVTDKGITLVTQEMLEDYALRHNFTRKKFNGTTGIRL